MAEDGTLHTEEAEDHGSKEVGVDEDPAGSLGSSRTQGTDSSDSLMKTNKTVFSKQTTTAITQYIR